MFLRAHNWFTALTGVGASAILEPRVNGMAGVHGVAITVTAGSNFSANIEVGIGGVWFVFATITHASTTLAFDLGAGWPMVRVNITDDTGADVDLNAYAVGMDHSAK